MAKKAKKGSLAGALKQAAHPATQAELPAPVTGSPGQPPSRQGKRAISAFFDPAASKQLRLLALEQDSTIQQLLREAINDLFEKHGRPRIA